MTVEEGPRRLRTALGGLTTRGRSFLAAGLAAVACAYLLGQPDLLRVGLLLVALPLVCTVVVYHTRYRIAANRSLVPSRITAMSEAQVRLRVENVSRVPTGLLMLQDRVDYLLGPRPRFVLYRVAPGGNHEVSYLVRPDLRGRYQLGPLQLKMADPFGMCELTRSFRESHSLTVVPAVEPLPRVSLAGETAGYGDARTRALALAGEDDVVPRGYRHGDDLRRVHWRSTARYGELMVRRAEQQQRSTATVLLDTRRIAHHGAGPTSSFEWAVAAAASLLVHLNDCGYAVRLLTTAGDAVPGLDSPACTGSALSPSTAYGDGLGLLLDTLAVVDFGADDQLTWVGDHLRDAGGLLVALLGEVTADQTALLAQIGRGPAPAVALILDGPAWAAQHAFPDDRADDRHRVLSEAGWTVLRVRPGDTLPALWQRAARQHASGVGRPNPRWMAGT